MINLKKIKKTWYFLLAVIIVYIVLFFVSRDSFVKSGLFFLNILKTIIPVFLMVFVLMILFNYFITTKIILKHFGNKSIKGWLFAVIAGMVSMGPIYMWYPLLSDAKSKGVSSGLIATFLYNRAIKLPLLPIIIFYFGIIYVLILMGIMIFMSVIQGLILEKIVKNKL